MRADDAPDAVIIGAGHNGLVAANLLADAGWSVVVCEATAHVGGAVRSAEVTAPGYESDLFSAFYPLAVASPVIRGLGLEAYGLSWAHSPAVLAHVFPDDRCALLSRDVEETAASVAQFAAGDAMAWRRLTAEWQQIGPVVLDALFAPLPALGPAARLLRTLGAGDALRMARRALLPVRRFGEECFAGDGARTLIAGNALHADLPPDGAGSAVYGWILTMLAQTVGFPVPVGGAGRLTAAMAARLAARGGSIRLSSPVVQLQVQSGQVSGVWLSSGELVRARRAVLADVGAPALYRDLIGEERLPAGLRRDLDNFEWDTPTLKIDWALKAPIAWTATPARTAGTIHLGVDLNGLSRYATDLSTRSWPREPFLIVGQMSTADPTRSPPGTESAWAYTHLPSGIGTTPVDIEAHVRLVERVLERHAPGFADLIVGRYVQSPAQLESENPALVNGSISGGTSQLHQQLVFRPVPGLGGASTPIDRLFLASSAAHPGGGVHGAPGANAARAALARNGVLGGSRRRVTQLALKRIYPDTALVRPGPTRAARTD